MKFLALISFRSLIKNKVKTLITSIGILLSVMLLATVVILSSSYKTSLIASTIKSKGDWHVYIMKACYRLFSIKATQHYCHFAKLQKNYLI